MTQNPKWTPGPYQVAADCGNLGEDEYFAIYDSHGVKLGWVFGCNVPSGEGKAVADLWAAAPEMAEALEAGIRELNRYTDANPQSVIALVKMRDALRKARGEME